MGYLLVGCISLRGHHRGHWRLPAWESKHQESKLLITAVRSMPDIYQAGKQWEIWLFNHYWQDSGRAVSRSVIIWKLHLTILGPSREPGVSEAKGSSSFCRNFLWKLIPSCWRAQLYLINSFWNDGRTALNKITTDKRSCRVPFSCSFIFPIYNRSGYLLHLLCFLRKLPSMQDLVLIILQ